MIILLLFVLLQYPLKGSGWLKQQMKLHPTAHTSTYYCVPGTQRSTSSPVPGTVLLPAY